MKIILIYTARSGSTSILKYFQKIKPNYICYNEPWFKWMQNVVYRKSINYDEIIKNDNLFIKSTLTTLSVPFEQIINDFDKVIFLLRKDVQSQVESSVLVHNEGAFLNHTPREYKLYSIDKDEYDETYNKYEEVISKITNLSEKYKIPLFYYEDLYYGDFKPLFDELDIQYNQELYNEFLNIKLKYRIGEQVGKNNKTII